MTNVTKQKLGIGALTIVAIIYAMVGLDDLFSGASTGTLVCFGVVIVCVITISCIIGRK